MTYEDFELGVIELAQAGSRITVANVAAGLWLAPSKVEPWLDQMAREGRLDVELDEDEGLIFYRVRGLAPPPARLVRRPAAAARTPSVRRRRKNAAAAAIIGLLIPGAGLLYAGPWSVAIIGTIVTVMLMHVFGAVPLIGAMLSSLALGLCSISSGVLGVLYAQQYNRHGRRRHLQRSRVASRLASWPHAAASAVRSAPPA